MVREPIAAGRFYLKGKESLKKNIKELFSDDLGPKEVRGKDAKAIIVPHAGYRFSGPCAAWGYEAIRDSASRTFILVGTNHSGRGPKVALTKESFETPLGTVETDKGIVDAICSNTIGKLSKGAHKYEHSIEVQLPFLQYLFDDFKIVPVLLSNVGLDDLEQVARVVANFEDTTLIASSDFTHYGPRYDFTPFESNVEEEQRELDRDAIDKIIDLDPVGFYSFAKSETTICGYLAISLLIYLSSLKGLEGELLQYYTSGDIMGDYSNSVGYASVAFY